ncbi:MAG: FHA domain-containing protein [Deltaproteobacteria bacterium]|nr:FHA domain-containing protein [Deltaproteobacteria bacterium]
MSGNGMRSTLGISLWAGQVRGTAVNAQTIMRPAVRPQLQQGRAYAARDLFVAAYSRFADSCRTFDEPGIAVVAVDEATGAPAGIVKLCAQVQRPVAAIVGRHDRCDLYLAHREELSLRQLAIVLDPVKNWQRGASNVRYRVLDLRTGTPIVDEDGKPMRGLIAEGPAIFRCAGYAMFILPLGDPTDWPASASDAWSMLPERVYLDELENAPQGSIPQIRMPRPDARETYITRTGGPRDTGMRLAQGDAAGVLELHTPNRQVTLTIGHKALADGILIGRYSRCDATEAAHEDHSLSRVHALLIQVDDRLLLVDTASTNGTFAHGEPARVVVFDGTTELRLGKRTFVRWRWVG